MSKRKVRPFPADILASIEKIEHYTAGVDFERFAADDLLVDAVVRNLEIIGKADRHIPEPVRQRYPEVPWPRVVNPRNIVVHEYFAGDMEIVRTIVRENFPELKATLQRMLTNLERK